MRAFSLAGLPARWHERCLDDNDCPAHARAFGSPSILVNGVDVGGQPPGDGSSCRLYLTASGTFTGTPSPDAIASILRCEATATHSSSVDNRLSWKRLGAAAPALGFALVPKVACPACWPAYAGVLSSLGVSFLIDARYLFAMTTSFLVIALFFLGFRARRRRGYGPLALGLLASTLLLIGKFYFESDPAMFGGVGLLMGASFWNSWPLGLATSSECSTCDRAPAKSCCDTAPPPPTAHCASATQTQRTTS